MNYTLTGEDGSSYCSPIKGAWGGHRGGNIYGRLDCPAALRAIAKGRYAKNRVLVSSVVRFSGLFEPRATWDWVSAGRRRCRGHECERGPRSSRREAGSPT